MTGQKKKGNPFRNRERARVERTARDARDAPKCPTESRRTRFSRIPGRSTRSRRYVVVVVCARRNRRDKPKKRTADDERLLLATTTTFEFFAFSSSRPFLLTPQKCWVLWTKTNTTLSNNNTLQRFSCTRGKTKNRFRRRTSFPSPCARSVEKVSRLLLSRWLTCASLSLLLSLSQQQQQQNKSVFTNPPAPMAVTRGQKQHHPNGSDGEQNSNSKDSKKSNDTNNNVKGFHHSDARNMDERPIPTIGAAHLQQQLEQEGATTKEITNGTHTTTAFLSVHDLVHFAITTSATRSQTLREIYETCEKHGRIAHKHNRKSRVITSNGHWKSQVRHALYTSKRFTRKDAKGVQDDRWRVIPQFANEPVHTVVVDDADDSEINGIATTTIANKNGTIGSNGKVHNNNSNKTKASVGTTKKSPKSTTKVTTNKRTTRKNPTKAQLAAATKKNAAENKSISSDLLHDAHVTGFQNGGAKSNGTQDIFAPSTGTKRSLGQIMDEDLSSFDMEAVGRKYMRFTPDPSLNDQTANLAGAIGGEVKHQHPYDQNPKVNGQMTRPLSPVARRSIPIFGPNELRNMRAKPRDLLRNRRKSSSASVGQAPCSPDAIDKLNEYFPKDSEMATMFSFF